MVAVLKIVFLRRHFHSERICRDCMNPLYMYTYAETIKRYHFPRAKVLELKDCVGEILDIDVYFHERTGATLNVIT